MKLKKPQFNVPTKYRHVPFLELLASAAFQHNQATLTEKPFEISMYSRASIVASALSIECAANCLASSLELTKALRDEIEKMPALSKIEICLQFKGASGFNRGTIEVSRIAELIRARNDFVHPKIGSVPGTLAAPEDNGAEWIFPITLDSAHHSHLNIPKTHLFWSRTDSLKVLNSVASFYHYVFIDLLKAERDELHELIIPRFETKNVHMPAVADEVKDVLASIKEKGVDFSFLALFD